LTKNIFCLLHGSFDRLRSFERRGHCLNDVIPEVSLVDPNRVLDDDAVFVDTQLGGGNAPGVVLEELHFLILVEHSLRNLGTALRMITSIEREELLVPTSPTVTTRHE